MTSSALTARVALRIRFLWQVSRIELRLVPTHPDRAGGLGFIAKPFLGSADIQSLADLANSFDVIRTMRYMPFTKETVFHLGVVTLAPLLPLLLTIFSLEELLRRLLSAVF